MAVAIGVALSGVSNARAQEAEKNANAESASSQRWAAEKKAVRLGHDGIALYEASRWDEAYQRFNAAEALVHSPVFLLYMARCRRNTGKLLEAAERFDRLSRERVSDDAPAAWHGAVADARAELIALRRSIPRIVVVLRAPLDSRLTLDGRELPASALGKSLDLDPGRHSIVARDPKGRRVVRSFQLTSGQATTTVDVSFQSAALTHPDSLTKASDPAAAWRTAGFVFLGVGAAGLGAGVGAAIVAADREGGQKDDWRAGSTVALASGAAIAGAGALLLLLSSR